MTLRQRILKLAYPLIMKLQQKKVNENMLENKKQTNAPVSFYTLEAKLISGQSFSFAQLKGKKALLVNVASNCGYTGQYEALEALYQQQKDKLVILGFPANDFKDQEPGTDEEIANFCKINYGVTFPLFQKQSVLETSNNPVYNWLTNEKLNGWNNQAPTWNFCKYLVDESGNLRAFYAAPVSPLGDEIKTVLAGG